MKDKFVVALTGVVCITALAITSIAMGIDGVLAGTAMTTIGAIIGGIFGYLTGKKE